MGQIVQENWASGTKIYHDTDEPKRYYNKVVGGIGWRGKKRPGFIIVVGQNMDKDSSLDAYHYKILKEYEHQDTRTLLEKAMAYKNNENISTWVGDMNVDVEVDVLDKINRDLHYEDYLRISHAPYADEIEVFEYCLRAIERKLDPHKLLHFGESKTRGYLEEVTTENRSALKTGDYPAITSLGFALMYGDDHMGDSYQDYGDGGGNDDKAYDYDPLRWK